MVGENHLIDVNKTNFKKVTRDANKLWLSRVFTPGLLLEVFQGSVGEKSY